MNRILLVCLSLAVSCLSVPGADWFVDVHHDGRSSDGSRSFPFTRLQDALNKATSGDCVTVAGGAYREDLRFMNRHGSEPIVIQAAAGARPVLSGFREAKGWRKGSDGLYRTTVSYKPQSLLIDGEYQQLVRLPETGWLRMNHTEGYAFTADMEDEIPVGTPCYVWIAWGNVYGVSKVTASQPGSYEIEKPWFRMSNNPKSPDRCFFVNHPALIRRSGQWGWKQLDKKSYEVFLKFDGSPKRSEILLGGAGIPLDVRNVEHVTISGFDIVGSSNQGLFLTGSKDVTVKDLVIYWNAGSGVWLRGCDGARVEKLRVACNHTGITTMGNRNVIIRGCDISHNFEDGLTVTWKSDHVLVEGNRFHHQISWGHPDNIQMYRDVHDVTFRDNLLFCGGQGIMAEQVRDITLENNLIVGTEAVAVIWGHQSSDNIVMKNNTVLFGGWGDVTMTGKGNTYSRNILMSNDFGKKAKEDHAYVGKENHFLTRGDSWFGKHNRQQVRTYDNYLKVSGETNSTRQVMPVKGMPAEMSVISSRDIAECTEDTVILRPYGGTKFAVGDICEINFDKVPRTVTKTTKSSISFSPALELRPLHAYVVLNWKDRKNLRWKPAFSSKAGSRLSYKYIRKDDFNGLSLPKNVKHFIKSMAKLIPPNKL